MTLQSIGQKNKPGLQFKENRKSFNKGCPSHINVYEREEIQMASDTRAPVDKKSGQVREKVQLQPGFHLADWMRRMASASASSLIGPQTSVHTQGEGGGEAGSAPLVGGGVRKISLGELAQHSSEFDCWTAYNGKVYSITQYMAYHPGGKKQLMLGAGKDCTDLFNKFHRWVNIDSILAKCVVGILCAPEPVIKEEEEEEEGEGKEKGDKEEEA